MKNKVKIFLSIMICLLPMIAGAILYNKLPDQMPVHFGANDIPDNYAPKAFALFGIPLLMAVIQTIVMLTTYVTAHKKDIDIPIVFHILEWLIPSTTVLFYGLMISFALDCPVSLGRIVFLVVGVVFAAVGNYTPKMSYDAGKQFFHPTPATEEAFHKMSRIMGFSFMGLGILFVIMGIFVM